MQVPCMVNPALSESQLKNLRRRDRHLAPTHRRKLVSSQASRNPAHGSVRSFFCPLHPRPRRSRTLLGSVPHPRPASFIQPRLRLLSPPHGGRPAVRSSVPHAKRGCPTSDSPVSFAHPIESSSEYAVPEGGDLSDNSVRSRIARPIGRGRSGGAQQFIAPQQWIT